MIQQTLVDLRPLTTRFSTVRNMTHRMEPAVAIGHQLRGVDQRPEGTLGKDLLRWRELHVTIASVTIKGGSILRVDKSKLMLATFDMGDGRVGSCRRRALGANRV